MKLLWSPLLAQSQWKPHKTTICPGNVLLLQFENTESSQDMHRKHLSWSTESNLILHTSETFSLRTQPVMSSWTAPCQIPWNPPEWCDCPPEVFSGQIHSPIIILLSYWSLCLLPSFLLDDPCCYACHCLAADTFFCLLTCPRHQRWTQALE